MAARTYRTPETLAEAIDFLHECGDETTITAGGTDVMVEMRAGRLRPRCILDISRLRELTGIRFTNDHTAIWIGAGVTIAEIRRSDLLHRYTPALPAAAALFASPQIRNAATIGGNIANCSPCADTAPPLLLYDAVALLKSKRAERTVPVAELAVSPYMSGLRRDEILTGFRLVPLAGAKGCFRKIGRRKALAVSRASLALCVVMRDEGMIDTIRLALGSCTPIPMRLPETEAYLQGKTLSEKVRETAGRITADTMIAVSGRRPSTAYKAHAVPGLLTEMLITPGEDP
jgi:CO/xanthine dehydrogenase FAD-binding subunit